MRQHSHPLWLVVIYWMMYGSSHTCSSLKERLDNLRDLPAFAPYLFTEPNFLSHDAKLMMSSFTRDEYGNDGFLSVSRRYSHCASVAITFSATATLAAISRPEWDVERIQVAISNWKDGAGFAQKTLMTVLRYALTASRVRSIETALTVHA